MLLNQQNIHFNNWNFLKNDVSFHFLFASLIMPCITPNINLLFQTSTYSRKKNLLKNSYIILAWFYYLNSIKSVKSNKGVRFFVLPTKNQVYTLTKAPIAHKLWSKEQYKFVFYLLRISFRNFFFDEYYLHSVNQGLLFVLTVKNSFPFFSSNLLILKTARICYFLNDSVYFSYF